MLNKGRGPMESTMTNKVQSSVAQSGVRKTEANGGSTGKPDCEIEIYHDEVFLGVK